VLTIEYARGQQPDIDGKVNDFIGTVGRWLGLAGAEIDSFNAGLEQVHNVLGERRDHWHVPPASGLGRVADLATREHTVDLERASRTRQPENVRPVQCRRFLRPQTGGVQEPPQHVIQT
jgi:hypothetical protein